MMHEKLMGFMRKRATQETSPRKQAEKTLLQRELAHGRPKARLRRATLWHRGRLKQDDF